MNAAEDFNHKFASRIIGVAAKALTAVGMLRAAITGLSIGSTSLKYVPVFSTSEVDNIIAKLTNDGFITGEQFKHEECASISNTDFESLEPKEYGIIKACQKVAKIFQQDISKKIGYLKDYIP